MLVKGRGRKQDQAEEEAELNADPASLGNPVGSSGARSDCQSVLKWPGLSVPYSFSHGMRVALGRA